MLLQITASWPAAAPGANFADSTDLAVCSRRDYLQATVRLTAFLIPTTDPLMNKQVGVMLQHV